MTTLGSLSFKTKLAAEQHIRGILARYHNGGYLAGEDIDTIRAIIDAHPNREAIVDCGIGRVAVQWLDPEGKERRFLAVRLDDSRRDFTWRHAIYPRSPLDQVRRLCRTAVADQIEAFRKAAFARDIAIVCPVSGDRVTLQNADVDHVAPATFAALVDRWLASNRLTPEDVEIVPSKQYQKPDRFQDVFLGENWVQFHSINAVLRVVSQRANRSLLRRKEQACGMQ